MVSDQRTYYVKGRQRSSLVSVISDHQGYLRIEKYEINMYTKYAYLTTVPYFAFTYEKPALRNHTTVLYFALMYEHTGPPLRSEFPPTDPEVQVLFPALPDFLRSRGSETGSAQPRKYNRGATWKKK
jgi:hypothetical protein